MCQSEYKDTTFDVLTTDMHTCVLTPGGLLLGETDDLILEEGEELSVSDIALQNWILTIPPEEALQIASFVEKHKGYLVERQKMIDAYFTLVARALLDGFTKEAYALYARGEHRWPQIRNEAYNALIALDNAGTNQTITTWCQQARRDLYFPREQQLELLFGYFRKLYFAKFPLPPEGEEAEEDESEESGDE